MEYIYQTPAMDEIMVSAEAGFAFSGDKFIIDPFQEEEAF